MAAPVNPHDRTKRYDEDDDDDPVEKMLKKSGCLELHYAVQVFTYILHSNNLPYDVKENDCQNVT